MGFFDITCLRKIRFPGIKVIHHYCPQLLIKSGTRNIPENPGTFWNIIKLKLKVKLIMRKI